MYRKCRLSGTGLRITGNPGFKFTDNIPILVIFVQQAWHLAGTCALYSNKSDTDDIPPCRNRVRRLHIHQLQAVQKIRYRFPPGHIRKLHHGHGRKRRLIRSGREPGRHIRNGVFFVMAMAGHSRGFLLHGRDSGDVRQHSAQRTCHHQRSGQGFDDHPGRGKLAGLSSGQSTLAADSHNHMLYDIDFQQISVYAALR